MTSYYLRALLLSAVQPLEWKERWGGELEDIPCWKGENPLGLHISIATYTVDSHSKVDPNWLAERMKVKQEKYAERVISAIDLGALREKVDYKLGTTK